MEEIVITTRPLAEIDAALNAVKGQLDLAHKDRSTVEGERRREFRMVNTWAPSTLRAKLRESGVEIPADLQYGNRTSVRLKLVVMYLESIHPLIPIARQIDTLAKERDALLKEREERVAEETAAAEAEQKLAELEATESVDADTVDTTAG